MKPKQKLSKIKLMSDQWLLQNWMVMQREVEPCQLVSYQEISKLIVDGDSLHFHWKYGASLSKNSRFFYH